MSTENVNYWLHRISHEWEASSWLLQNGYLSLGWAKMADSGIEKIVREEDGKAKFEEKMQAAGEGHNRSRWNLWYFCRFQVGDIVVTPLYDGKFSVLRVEGTAMPITALPASLFTAECGFIKDSHNLVNKNDGGEPYDLGFAVPVSVIRADLLRSEYADRALTARMKMRQTNGEIDDIKASVEAAISAQAPINLYASVIEKLSAALLEEIKDKLNPNKLEKLVRWYFQKSGASNAYIPGKNEAGKVDKADADVVAWYDSLKIVFYVQVKMHRDYTSEWAVQQIAKYKEQKEAPDDYTVIPWVISTCDGFDNAAIATAAGKVRLIDGKEFASMLIDAGITDINRAFE